MISMATTGAQRFNKDKDVDKLIYGGDLSKYGKDFQIKLLSLLVKDRVFSFSIIPIIKDEYFSDVYLKTIYSCIREYITSYSAPPSIDNIKIELQNKNERIAVYERILENIDNADLSDRDFVIKNSRRFCFSKHALLKMEEMKLFLEQGDFEKAKQLSIEAFKHSGLETRKIYDLKQDYEKIFQEDLLHRPIATPWPSINKATKGGPGSGNLVIMVAPSNFGKTAVLTAIAREANSQGKNVAFFSFEIGGVDILRRYIAGRLGVNQEDLKYQKNEVKDCVLNSQLGDFKLLEERATRATVENIKTDIEYLKSIGFFPDLICVDSLNQLKLLGADQKWRMRDDNQKFEYLSEELRDLANELELPVYTVMQTNRTGFTNEINDIMTIGKAIEPFQVADVLMTYAQPPEMASENKCIALLLKNRLGPKNIVLECFYDPNQGIFKQLNEVPELLLLSNKRKEEVKSTVTSVREKLRTGAFDRKK